MGDLTQLFPVVNFTFRGFEGRLHGEDFRITDEEKAYILPAKLMALTIYRLLRNDARKAKKIVDDFTPVSVSYTHLDVYKRQGRHNAKRAFSGGDQRSGCVGKGQKLF